MNVLESQGVDLSSQQRYERAQWFFKLVTFLFSLNIKKTCAVFVSEQPRLPKSLIFACQEYTFLTLCIHKTASYILKPSLQPPECSQGFATFEQLQELQQERQKLVIQQLRQVLQERGQDGHPATTTQQTTAGAALSPTMAEQRPHQHLRQQPPSLAQPLQQQQDGHPATTTQQTTGATLSPAMAEQQPHQQHLLQQQSPSQLLLQQQLLQLQQQQELLRLQQQELMQWQQQQQVQQQVEQQQQELLGLRQQELMQWQQQQQVQHQQVQQQQVQQQQVQQQQDGHPATATQQATDAALPPAMAKQQPHQHLRLQSSLLAQQQQLLQQERGHPATATQQTTDATLSPAMAEQRPHRHLRQQPPSITQPLQQQQDDHSATTTQQTTAAALSPAMAEQQPHQHLRLKSPLLAHCWHAMAEQRPHQYLQQQPPSLAQPLQQQQDGHPATATQQTTDATLSPAMAEQRPHRHLRQQPPSITQPLQQQQDDHPATTTQQTTTAALSPAMAEQQPHQHLRLKSPLLAQQQHQLQQERGQDGHPPTATQHTTGAALSPAMAEQQPHQHLQLQSPSLMQPWQQQQQQLQQERERGGYHTTGTALSPVLMEPRPHQHLQQQSGQPQPQQQEDQQDTQPATVHITKAALSSAMAEQQPHQQQLQPQSPQPAQPPHQQQEVIVAKEEDNHHPAAASSVVWAAISGQDDAQMTLQQEEQVRETGQQISRAAKWQKVLMDGCSREDISVGNESGQEEIARGLSKNQILALDFDNIDTIVEEASESTRLNLNLIGEYLSAAAPSVEQCVGKNIVIVVGQTDSGKSTFIHKIARRTLQKKEYRDHKDGSERLVYIADEPLEDFVIGHSKTSQTKHIRHYVPICDGGPSSVVYLDSAGYSDTSGIEVEIATSVSFYEVAMVCKAIRFVVLINCHSFHTHRGDIVRSIVRLISTFVDDFFEHREAFTFLFTHADEALPLPPTASASQLDKVRQEILKQLYDIYSGMNQGDYDARKILLWIIQCLGKEKHSLVDVLHVIHTNTEELIKSVESFSYEQGQAGRPPAIGLSHCDDQRPCDVVRTGWTTEIKFQIKHELEQTHRDLVFALNSQNIGYQDFLGSVPPGGCGGFRKHLQEITPLCEAITYMQSHIKLDFVKGAYIQAKQLVYEQFSTHKEQVFHYIEKGTSSDFNGDFTAAHARCAMWHIKVVSVLAALELGSTGADAMTMHQQMTTMVDDLDQQLERLSQKVHASFDFSNKELLVPLGDVGLQLAKLHAWGEAEPQLFGEIALAATGKLRAFVECTVATATCAEATADEVGTLIGTVAYLQQLQAYQINLRHLGIAADVEIKVASDRLCECLQQCLSSDVSAANDVLDAVVSSGTCHVENANLEDEAIKCQLKTTSGIIGVEMFTARVQHLECMVEALERVNTLPELAASSKYAWQSILDRINGQFQRHHSAALSILSCTDIKDEVRRAPLLEASVQMIAAWMSVLSPLQQAESEGGRLHLEVITAVAASVRDRVVQLQTLCGQMDQTHSFQRHVDLLRSISASVWLDQFLVPADRRFVNSSLETFLAKHLSHFEKLKSEVIESTQQYMDMPKENHANLDSIRTKLTEGESLEADLNAMQPNFIPAQESIRIQIEEIINVWSYRYMDSGEFHLHLPSEFTKIGDMNAAAVDALFEVYSNLAFIEHPGLQSCFASIESQLRAYFEQISAVMNTAGVYDTKHAVLKAVFEWQHDNLSQLMARFPELSMFSEDVGKGVNAQAQQVRDLIMESPDSADTNTAIEAFSEALAVDKYILYLAKHEHSNLKQLLDMKRANIDELHQSNIMELNFTAGVADHLASLTLSKDMESQIRGKTMLETIYGVVLAKIEAVERMIASADGMGVAKAIRLLQCANDEVGTVLVKHKAFSIDTEVDTLIQHVSRRLNQLIEECKNAMMSTDYLAIQIRCHDLSIFYQSIADVVPEHDVKELTESTVNLAENSLEAIVALVDDFVGNFLKPSKDRVDTSQLLVALNSLKRVACDVSSTADSRDSLSVADGSETLDHQSCADIEANAKMKLAAHYDKVKNTLQSKLYTEVFLDINEKLKEYQLYSPAVELYMYLNSEWDKGLKDHQLQLGFDITGTLQDLQRLSQKQDDDLHQWLYSVSEIDNYLLPQLNKLKAQAERARNMYFWWGPQTSQKLYTEKQQSLVKEISILLDITRDKVAQDNFLVANSHARILWHIKQVLGVHIPRGPDASHIEHGMSEVTAQIRNKFETTCAELVAAIEKSNIAGMMDTLKQYFNFVLYLGDFAYPFIKPDVSAVHKKLFTITETQLQQFQRSIESLNFIEVSERVPILRMLSCVLGTIYEVHRGYTPAALDIHWIQQVKAISSSNFTSSISWDNLSQLHAYWLVLGLRPIYGASDKSDIQRAYIQMSAQIHPDKPHGSTQIQQQVVTARDVLSDDERRATYHRGIQGILSQQLNRLPSAILSGVVDALSEQVYEPIKKILDQWNTIHALNGLVSEDLSLDIIRQQIDNAIRAHVAGVKESLETYWSNREFVNLQMALKSLEDIGDALNMYSELLTSSSDTSSGSWRRDIRDKLEHDIEVASHRARQYLDSETKADKHQSDFALQLIYLGRVLYELTSFKEFVKHKICDVLDVCQEQPWGASYIFKLGLLLEQGRFHVGEASEGTPSGDDADDQHVGKFLVSTFQHFKDVKSYIWNQEIDARRKTVAECLALIASRQVTRDGVSSGDPTPIRNTRLSNGFKCYEQEYDKCFECWCQGSLTLEQLASVVVKEAADLRPCSTTAWTCNLKDKIPELLGRIFAYFTILKSGASYQRLRRSEPDNAVVPSTTPAETTEMVSAASVLIRPHTIQILTILRLFGYDTDDKESKLTGHMMQIRTGEGKSMILGASSTLFGLLGFSVRCVCYSNDLSMRDRDLFQDLFSAFGVAHCIKYSRITDYSEDTMKAKGNLRTLTLDLLCGRGLSASIGNPANTGSTDENVSHSEGNQSCHPSPSAAILPSTGAPTATSSSLLHRSPGASQAMPLTPTQQTSSEYDGKSKQNGEEILLVDEVDVFFGKDFYGQTHNQTACLPSEEIREILQLIWDQRAHAADPGVILRLVQASEPYRSLRDHTFRNWAFLLDSEISAMCHDLKNFKTPKPIYVRNENRIGYEIMDSVDTSAVYGYRTAFAYLDESARSNLRNSDEALKEGLQLRVSCGKFSYANIDPACILGVSGTMEALSKYEWSVMKGYGIDLYTQMPSVYGESNFRFFGQTEGLFKPITIENTKLGFFGAITDQVNDKIRQMRAVVVFFVDSNQLSEYVASAEYTRVRTKRKTLLREQEKPKDKETAINKAASTGQVTFATAVFGRGTDFFCQDRKLLDNGGVHVIQAFFSTQKSEELQIQGRTARQGRPGTYSMILLQEDLQECLQVSESSLCHSLPPRELYAALDRARQRLNEATYVQIESNLEKATAVDTLSHAYFDALLANDNQLAMQTFRHLHDALQTSSTSSRKSLKKSRMICLSDATGSMAKVWSNTSASIQEMLERVQEIGGANLELQWMAYRDYDSSADELLEKSPWSSDPSVLKDFVSQIVCGGGGDYEEAVEIALQEVRKEHERQPVTRVLLIGDAPPHYQKQGDDLRPFHDHVLTTDYLTEAEKLAELNIPVYTFYIGYKDDLIDAFTLIAEKTHGDWQAHHSRDGDARMAYGPRAASSQ
ncbi:hypothetical protein CYMTET_18851 [Cymbomonas tetramitiformis]|uniref:chloroplast protein-transporting ATPase n=1 Tax=Cymbomonas tetramitiformis TaxID=36881 RepID=A0AAE0G773_9CHLO|nr:hypothetical protein CYMTET_18851 [Cymbomonas tetramitiformis]